MGHGGAEVTVNPKHPSCCFCHVPLLLKARAYKGNIIRGWLCPKCGLDVKGEKDVLPEEAIKVLASLNILDAKIDD